MTGTVGNRLASAGSIAFALFLGRLVPELTGRPWPWPLTLAFNALLVGLALWLSGHAGRPVRPDGGTRVAIPMQAALLLLLYLPYPYADPQVAAGIAVLAVAVGCAIRWTDKDRAFPSIASPLGRLARSPIAYVLSPIALDALVFMASLSLYIHTLAPDVLPADSGEFQLVAAVLGVAHPPGYPLHTILGWLMTQLPIGTLPWRVNLLSALMAAGTVALVSATVRHFTGRKAAGVAAALALATSTTFWAQATISNVRTPAAFFTALCAYALARHARTKASATRYLILFAASLTLGLTHHLSLVFVGTLLTVYLFLIDPSLIREPRRWRWPILVALLCLLPLAYLPLRSGAPLGPENLNTVEGFLHHALALGFSSDFFYFVTPAGFLARLQVMGNVLAFQFHPLVLVTAAGGAILLLWKDRRLALLLVGGFALHTLVTATYRAPQTVEYMLPAYVFFAITIGYGLGNIAPAVHLQHQAFPKTAFYLLTVALITGIGLLQGGHHYPSYRALSIQQDARSYAAPILAEAPEGAIVLADLHWAMPLQFLHQVERARPDLTIEYVYPTAEPYEETWARRIREEMEERPVVVTHYHEMAYADIPAVFEPLGEAFYVRPQPRRALPAGFTPCAVQISHDGHEAPPANIILGDALAVLGYQLATNEDQSPTILTLAWSPRSGVPMSLFAHLVGLDGAVYAQQDQVLDTRFLSSGDVALTQFRLYARPGTLPGRYSLQIGAYTPDGPLPTSSGEDRTELLSLELAQKEVVLFTQRPRRQTVGNGLSLVGVDWDLTLLDQPRLYLHWQAQRHTAPLTFSVSENNVPLAQGTIPSLPAGSRQVTVHTLSHLPSRPTIDSESGTFIGPWALERDIRLQPPRAYEQYVPFGAGIIYLGFAPRSLSVPPSNPRLHFAASYPIQRDYAVSTSLIVLNPDDSWAWLDLDDGIPALGAIPTLKWISGSRVTDPHTLSIPPDSASGRVIGTLRIYDAFTGRPLPLLDERLAGAAPWAPMGEWILQP